MFTAFHKPDPAPYWGWPNPSESEGQTGLLQVKGKGKEGPYSEGA